MTLRARTRTRLNRLTHRNVHIIAAFAVAALAAPASAEDKPATPEEAEPAAAEPTEEGKESEPLNSISFGGSYVYLFEKHRDSQTDGQPLGHGEHLGGFVIGYDRILIPGHLSLTIAKPFHFGHQRFDTPFDFILKGLFPVGDWEPFIGLLLTWNIRVFERERAAKEGQSNIMSFGIGAVAGTAYFFSRKWGLELELGYLNIPTDDIVEHEFSVALLGVYRFGPLRK